MTLDDLWKIFNRAHEAKSFERSHGIPDTHLYMLLGEIEGATYDLISYLKGDPDDFDLP